MSSDVLVSATPKAAELTVSPFRLKPTSLLLTCLLLVVSSVAWRKGVYFSGGADIVVLTKAALTGLALGLAWLMPRAPGTWSRFRAAPVLWLAAYLVISVIGGALSGDEVSSTVLAVRLALMAVALLLVTVSHPWQEVVSAMASAMLLLAVVAGVTGVSSLAETGRLYGGIPPINANEICLLVSVPVALLFWKCVYASARPYEYLALLPLLGIIWLTGARTGLAALVLALLVMMVMAPRVPALVAAGVVAAVPLVAFVAAFTPLVAQFAGRGDLAGVTTLNSRTVAWQAALNYADTPAETLFGSGLALKQIPVTAMYRSQQILDSTWISALIQVGYVGCAVLVLFVLVTLVQALKLPAAQRSLVFCLAAIVTAVGVLESGMFDTTPAFIVFFTASVMAHRVTTGASPAARDVASRVPG